VYLTLYILIFFIVTLFLYGKTILSKHFYKLEKLKLIDIEIVIIVILKNKYENQVFWLKLFMNSIK